MTLNYCFGEDSFEYELTMNDEKYCIMNTSKDVLLEIFNEHKDNEEFDVVEEIEECLSKGNEKPLRDWAYEMFDILDEFEEIAEEFFEYDARERYEDEREYRRDPMGYYGLSQSDFI